MSEHICDLGITDDGLIVRRTHVRELIVRCCDCKYGQAPEIGCIRLDDRGGEAGRSSKGFCAWGVVLHEPTCLWVYDSDTDSWDTECGNKTIWEPYGIPAHCPNCGAKAVEQ
ncbi:MAG: hypothetical protein RR505_10445 [Raoultibacter sp.]